MIQPDKEYGIRIQTAGSAFDAPAMCCEMCPEDYDLWFIWAGNATLQHGSREVVLSHGCCVLLQPGETYILRNDPVNPLGAVFIHLLFVDDKGQCVEAPPSLTDRTLWHIEETGRVEEILKHVVRAHARGARHALEAQCYLRAFLLEMEAQSKFPNDKDPLSEQRHRVEPVLRMIRENPSVHYCIDELAAKVHWSPTHFSRMFKLVTGMNPSDLMIEVRVDCAQRLLRLTTMNVSEIADVLNYPNVYYFSRQFKQKTGQSPTEYRKAMQTDSTAIR